MATAKTLLPPPYQTLEDIDGHAVANGTVTFLDTGTAVLATVYADANGAVVSANPLTVDAAGRFTVFLSTGQVVDVEYRDAAGALIKTVPGVQAVPSASGNVDVAGVFGETVTPGQLVYLSAGDGALTAGRWYLGNTSQFQGLHRTLGFALTGGSAGTAGTMRTAGRMEGLTGLVVGGAYYPSAAPPGALSLAFQVRGVGQADSTTSLVITANPPDIGTFVEYLPDSGSVAVLGLLAPGRTALLKGGADLYMSGITAGVHGQRITLVSSLPAGALVHLLHGAAGPTGLRNFVTSAPTLLVPGGTAEYMWDVTLGAWAMIAHEQGGWVTPAFNAADYGATGGMTWVVAAGDVQSRAFYVRGRTMTFHLGIYNSSLGGVAGNLLTHTIPGGYLVDMSHQVAAGTPMSLYNVSGPAPAALAQTQINYLTFAKDLSGSPVFQLGVGTYVILQMNLPLT